MTVDAFLKWDDGTDTRYELVDGQVMAIPMRWAAQALLVTKLVTAIHARASPGFVVYTGVGYGWPTMRRTSASPTSAWLRAGSVTIG